MIDHDLIVKRASEVLSRAKQYDDRWEWKEPDHIPSRLVLVHDRDRRILWLRVMDYWPGKARPSGWALLWHKWNKGFTLSYIPPEVGQHLEQIVTETPTTIHVDQISVPNERSFWQCMLPHGFAFTIGKITGKWRMNRHTDPFMRASLDAAPLLSSQEWAELGTDGPEILEKT